MTSIICGARLRIGVAAALLSNLFVLLPVMVLAQGFSMTWQREVRDQAQRQNWPTALAIVTQVLTTNPQDLDALAWRARLLLWSGNVKVAETEFLSLSTESPKDPDVWQGLAEVYERQARWNEALTSIEQAKVLDSNRTDIRIECGHILEMLKRTAQARLEFSEVLALDPTNSEAKAGLLSLARTPTEELRIGTDSDLLSYAGTYGSEWVRLTSSWPRNWTTSIEASFFQRGGLQARKFTGSVGAKSVRFGTITGGGAISQDSAIIPRSEAFLGLDRGWRLSESRSLRGIEADYEEHWYWYSSARVFTVTGGGLVYLPHDWMWSISAAGARSSFPGLSVDWQPSGVSRLSFPVWQWSEHRTLRSNVFVGIGSEDFALIDQVGSFASHTYGGGFRLQLNAIEDLTGSASFQQRTQSRTDVAFGLNYGIRF
jgi:tetratricopeptide (TPR) repeat protein